ncbi:MAG: contact-dependent growth inhibition system immunity protein [Nocardioides sp.]
MRPPGFWHFAGVYVNEDWPFAYGDVWAALDAFIAESPDLAAKLVDEIRMVLTALSTEDELRDYVLGQGAAYAPGPEDGGYRGWLLEVARRVASACS